MKSSKSTRLEEPFMAEITFTTEASLHRDYGGENFVHEITGRISIRNTADETEETAGGLRVWLIQFIEAQAHGISSRVLGDGYTLELRRYWQELFDFDELKPEIQKAWQTEGSDLLVIRSIQILDRFQDQGIGLAAVARTIDLFSRSCDLVACLPEAMEESLDSEILSSGAMRSQADRQHMRKAISVLVRDLRAAGFRALGETGLYLLNPTYERPHVLLE